MTGKNAQIAALKSFQPDILAIQSAVMIGAVGNDAAMPVYTHFRQKAARLDTVRLAAHPGFGPETEYAQCQDGPKRVPAAKFQNVLPATVILNLAVMVFGVFAVFSNICRRLRAIIGFRKFIFVVCAHSPLGSKTSFRISGEK